MMVRMGVAAEALLPKPDLLPSPFPTKAILPQQPWCGGGEAEGQD